MQRRTIRTRPSARFAITKVIPEMAMSWVEMGGVTAGYWQVMEGCGIALVHDKQVMLCRLPLIFVSCFAVVFEFIVISFLPFFWDRLIRARPSTLRKRFKFFQFGAGKKRNYRVLSGRKTFKFSETVLCQKATEGSEEPPGPTSASVAQKMRITVTCKRAGIFRVHCWLAWPVSRWLSRWPVATGLG